MPAVLAALFLAISMADHWSTWLCLRQPVAGWEVVEANPLAAWLFAQIGLVPGLAVDSALSLAAVIFLLTTSRVPRAVSVAFLASASAWTALAVSNNLDAAYQLGLGPFALG